MASPSKGLQHDGREMPPEPNDNMEKSEETEQIRREMHLAISKRDLDQVQKCLNEAKYLRQWLNPDNGESALCSAVRHGAFRISGLLRCYNCIPSKENKEKESKTLTDVGNIEKLEYRYQLFRYARESPNSCYLIPRSHSIGSCGETKLPELYQKLNEIPYVKTILQVVATSPHVQIMFDFNNEDLECTLWYQDNRGTWGMTFFDEHEIHIGAKREENELLGTLAHELCHYALQLVYENEAKPYTSGDKSTEALYVDILKEIQDKKESVHDVIKRAFIKDSVREEELVVRVPHLLAMDSEQILQEHVPKLLQFFKNNVIRDMNDFLKKSFGQRDREAIKEQNARLGKTERTEKLGITFKTKYKLKEKALLVLTAPNMTFLEVMINYAVRSTGESYVFLDTVQWDKELKDAMLDNKCYYVILSSDPEFDLGEKRRAMLELLVELSTVRETKVILLTKDRRQDDFVKDMMDQEYFIDKVEVTCVSHAQFDVVTDECKEKVLRSSRICFQRKRNARISEDDVKVFCKALDEDTFLQLCRTKKIRVMDEQPSENENDGSCYVERKCARVTQVHLKEALRHERNEAFAIVGCSRKRVRELDPTNIDEYDNSEVKKFRKCVLLDNVGQYDTLKESPFYKDKTIHLIQYKGENTEKECGEKNMTDTDRVHTKPTRATPPCSGKGKSTGYQWVRSNGPVGHLPMVDGGTRQILNEKALRGIIAEKVVAILGAPGMGKSLLSSRMAQDINNDEKNWVLHVNLVGKTGFLNLSASLNDSHHAVEQLAKLCDVKAGTFDFSLLQHSIQNGRPFKVVVIFDEFDEVDVKCRQLVMKLVRGLSATQISKLFLFSRTLCKSEIEDTFHTIAFELIGFDEQQQLEFLKKYWKRNDLEMDDAKFHSFAQRTLSGFRASGKDSVTENPLLLRMIAEIEEEQLNQLELGAPEDKTVLTGPKRGLLAVYKKLVANKFRIYREKLVGKRDSNESALAAQYDAAVLEHHFYESYSLLALKVILHQELITKLLEESTLRKLEKSRGLMKDAQEGRLKHGFLDEHSGETPVFLHKTFAEFFAARFLAHKINSATSTDDVVYDVVAHMYGSEEYSGVLDFFDAMGTKSHSLHRYIMNNDSESVKNAIKEWHSVDEFGRMPLHVAALHADEEILNIISSELGDKLVEELREKDMFGMTPLMYVDRIRAWKKLDMLCTRCTDQNMKLVKQLRAVNEIITKERRFEHSVFSEAVIMECSELLHCFSKAWCSRKNINEYITREYQDKGRRKCSEERIPVDANVVEIPINIGGALSRCSDIQAVSASGLSLFHMSASLGLVDICRYLTFLLPADARDKYGETPLQEAAIYGHPNVVHILLPHSTSKVVTDKNESTPLHAIPKFHGLFELRTLYLRALDRANDLRWWTSSHETALKGHDVVLSLILPHVDGTIRNRSGESALHESARNLFWRSIVLLLPYSDVDSVNHSCETPMLRSVSDNSLLRNLRTTSFLKESVECSKEVGCQSIASVKLFILHSDVTVAAKEDRVALHQCVSAGHQDVMRLLLPLSSVSSVDKSGNSSLHCAAESGNIECCKVLLPLSSVNAPDGNGITALHVSAFLGHADITRLLLLFASTEFPDEEEPIPLHYSTLNGHSDVVECLLPHSLTSCTGSTSLHLSANEGHLDVARVILPHSDPLIRNIGGDTALHVVAYYRYYKAITLVFPYSEADTQNNSGSIALVDSLRGYIESLNGQGESDKDRSKRTDMLVREDIETIKLLSLHSDVNIPDNDGSTALHVSTSIGRMDITKLILPLSSISALDKNGFCNLHYAAASGNVDCFKFLLPLSSINALGGNGITELHVSASLGYADITRLLLLFASTEFFDEEEATPLHHSALTGHSDVIEYLLPHSLTSCTESTGSTSLHLSANEGHFEVARVILPHSDPLIRNIRGDTALHLGAYYRYCKAIKLVLPYSEADTQNNSGSTALVDSISGYIECLNGQGESDKGRSKRTDMLVRDDIETIKLLSLHSDVNIPDNDGSTALHVSTSRGRMDITKLILPLSSISALDSPP